MTLTQKLGLRVAAIVASFLFVALPVHAAPGDLGFDLTKPRILFETACTDSNDTPATTVNIDLTNTDNWDTVQEAINPDRNLRDAVQVSGSADGWCDAKPWVVKGLFNVTTAQDMWFGPIHVNPSGVYISTNMNNIGTNWAWLMDFVPGWPGATADSLMFHAVSTSTANTLVLFGPFVDDAGPVGDSEHAPFPVGVKIYLRFDANGTDSAWAGNAATMPLLNHLSGGNR